MIKKGTWVEIEETVLIPEERSQSIPEETKVTDEIAKAQGMDVGFGRGSNGTDVASFIIKKLMGLDTEAEE